MREPGSSAESKGSKAPVAARGASSSAVLEAARRRLVRSATPPPSPSVRDVQLRRAMQEGAAARERARLADRRPVLTLEPPSKPADARALASLLADDTAQKLDQLCYVWSVIQELEPFQAAGEASLRRRAAELMLAASGGGGFEIPLEGPLRAVRSFLASHGMHEEYVESLCAWYLDREKGPPARGVRR